MLPFKASRLGLSPVKVNIQLAGKTKDSNPTYTTRDRIDGIATLAVARKTPFDDVEITLEGQISTAVDGLYPSQNRETSRQFLWLPAWIDESLFPASRVLEAGREYKFPFTLVVPDRVSSACNHRTAGDHVSRSHEKLPPSFGSSDMAPSRCEVSYCVRAAVMKNSSKEGKSPKAITNATTKVRIIPTVEEEPPIHSSHLEKMYRDQNKASVKTGLLHLGKQLGRLTVTSSQPAAVQLRPRYGKGEAVSSSALVNLRFDPAGDELPPRLNTVSSDLRVTTVFATMDLYDYPSTVQQAVYYPGARDLEVTNVSLSKQCVASTKWVKHEAGTPRESLDSRGSISSSSTLVTQDGSCTFYTASIEVPVVLPQGKKAFVPSFHYCLLSRVYSLELGVSYQSSNGNLWKSSVDLSVPIQFTTLKEGMVGTTPSFKDTDYADLDTKGVLLMDSAPQSSLPAYSAREN